MARLDQDQLRYSNRGQVKRNSIEAGKQRYPAPFRQCLAVEDRAASSAGTAAYLVPAYEILMNFALLFAAYILCIFIHVSGMAAASFWLRLHVEEVALFFFPILRKRIRGVEFSLGWFPTGGYVRIEAQSFENRGVIAKTVVMLSGCLLLFAVAVLAVGPATAGRLFTDAYWQVPLGACLPLGRGADLARQALDFAGQQDFVTILGSSAAVITAMQLLPLPTWNGGELILNVLQPLLGWSVETRYRWGLVGSLIGILMCLSWGVAFVVALLK